MYLQINSIKLIITHSNYAKIYYAVLPFVLDFTKAS